MRTIAEGHEPLNYFVDLSTINVFAENGEIWVPDESMVEVFIISSDPDVVSLGEGGTSGTLCFGYPGVATIDFQIYHEGKLIALKSETFLVYDNDAVKLPVQDIFVKFQERNSEVQGATSPDS